jgi:hypothetical protein
MCQRLHLRRPHGLWHGSLVHSLIFANISHEVLVLSRLHLVVWNAVRNLPPRVISNDVLLSVEVYLLLCFQAPVQRFRQLQIIRFDVPQFPCRQYTSSYLYDHYINCSLR